MPYSENNKDKRRSKNMHIRLTPHELSMLVELTLRRTGIMSDTIRTLIEEAWTNEVKPQYDKIYKTGQRPSGLARNGRAEKP